MGGAGVGLEPGSLAPQSLRLDLRRGQLRGVALGEVADAIVPDLVERTLEQRPFEVGAQVGGNVVDVDLGASAPFAGVLPADVPIAI